MLPAIKNLLIHKPWYVALYIVVLILLTVSSYIEYRSRYQDLLQLVQDQAAMTAAVIAQSGSGQAFLTEEIKQSYINHAITTLNILNKIDAENDLGTDRLDQLTSAGNMLKIIIFDDQGRVEHSVVKDRERMLVNAAAEGKWALQHIQPILRNEKDLIIVGVDQNDPSRDYGMTDSFEENARFLVGIARDRGGALVCHLSVSDDEDFKYLTAIESALEDLLKVRGLQYLKLTVGDQEPYYVSKMNSVVDDSWTRLALADILYQVTKGDTSLLEVVRPVFFESSFGEVRIGFNGETLIGLRGQIIIQILVRTALLTILAFVMLIFLLSRQNAALLEREKKRIEAEVYHLEKLNRLREKQAAMGELAAGVAHEIRNPLNAIGIVAQRLKREFEPGQDVEEYQNMTSTMVSEIKRINHSLQDFLEYTRPTPLKFTNINSQQFLNHLMGIYQSQALDSHVELVSSSESFSFAADSEYLQQALANLIKNAIEACGENSSVNISAYLSKATVTFVVEDNGSGIAAKELSRIFDLYYTTKDMGTGVGLALTHKIIADHNGTIEVKSTPGIGTHFEINLPVKQ